MANVEIETESGETGFIDEGAEIARIAHFAHGVLHADRDARMMRVQNQVLESTESSVALSRIGGFAGAAHVKDEAGVGGSGRGRTNARYFVHLVDGGGPPAPSH